MSFNLCIFCGSSSPKNIEVLYRVEEMIDFILLSNPSLSLVYGGADIGLMGAVANKFLGSNRDVIGVMPTFLKNREVNHTSLTEFIETESMHDRKQIMYDKADAFLVLPGGLGTLDELFETACWSQLDQHKKPICVYNPVGFFDDLGSILDTMLKGGFISASDRGIIKIESDFPKVLSSLGI